MNEQDAIQKWCPFARSQDFCDGKYLGASVNRQSSGQNQPEPVCMCIASRCMAWRDGQGAAYGYCGLVGRGNRETV